MRRRVAGGLLALGLLLPGPGRAEPPPPDNRAPRPGTGASAPDSEALIFSLPVGWTPVPVETSDTYQKTVFHPPQSGVPGTREMIIISLARDPEAPDVRTAQMRSATDYAAVCEASASSALQLSVEGGGGRGFWTISCPRRTDTGRGEVSFFLYLRGTAGSYLVQMSWETGPFASGNPPLGEERMTRALAFLDTVHLEQRDAAR